MTAAPPIGARVRLRAPPHALALLRDTGTVSAVAEDGLHVLVALDDPAVRYEHDGRRVELPHVIEAADNLDVLDR